ncbi:MAG: hypothetical protein ACK4OI_21110, partial [Rhizobium oryzihabitans]
MTSDVTSLTFLSLFLPFLAALAAPALVKRFGHNAAWILAIAPGLAFAHFALMLPQVAAGGVVTGGYAWVPSFNLSFSWFIDGLSLTFALLITGIGLLNLAGHFGLGALHAGVHRALAGAGGRLAAAAGQQAQGGEQGG